MGFSRQEYWRKLPSPSAGDLPDPGIEPISPALQVNAFNAEPLGKPQGSLRNCLLKGPPAPSTWHCLGPAGFNSTQAKSQVRRPKGKQPTLEVGFLHLLAVWTLFLFSCPHTYATTSHCPFDPWKTWAWTAWVHLDMIFFNRKYYSTTWSMTGRIHVCRGTAYTEGQLWVTDGFLTAWRVATPNPCEFDRLTVYVIESSLTVPQEFWLMEKNGWWTELWIAQGEGPLSSRGFLLSFKHPRL